MNLSFSVVDMETYNLLYSGKESVATTCDFCSVFVRFREPYVDTLLDLKQFFKWYMIRFVVEGMDIESDTCVMGLDYVLTM